MSPTKLLVAIGVALGLALVVVGILLRERERDTALAQVLELPWGENDVDVASVTESTAGLLAGPVGFANAALDRLDRGGKMALRLERARLRVRPGEFVVIVTAASVIGAIIIALATSAAVLGVISLAAGPIVAHVVLDRKIDKRRRAFEAQLPGALSLVAASLSGGHTFLRSIQMMCEEAEAPLSEEFGRVVTETRLGAPLLESLRSMATRVGATDLEWVVQAISIQQSTGGRLADLLHTLADYMRAREEVAREVRVLGAESRASAWVLTAVPIFIVVFVNITDPGFMKPLFHGFGLLALIGAGVLTVLGALFLLRLARSVEL